ncbi:MAG: hypothetical protein JWR77_1788, partial [Rhizorhabdus sp.]|nr:hypothetical protein [Rhizorhabdus sp.]
MAAETHLPGPFGMLVDDLDVRTANDADMRRLGELLFANRILVVRGQSLTNDDYVAFGRKWGDPIAFLAPRNTLATHPEMIIQSNAGQTPEMMRNNAAHWHCDSSYEPVAATVTMLLGVLAPQRGGETMFANLVAAYDALPEDEKARIDALEVRHMPSRGRLAQGEFMLKHDRMTEEHKANANRFGPVVHPLVPRHPVTGRRALYALGGTPYEVLGMDEAEGVALLDRLKAHATEDRFVQAYKLMPGDVLLWDNFGVMHRATPIDYTDEPDAKRLNYRISVRGVPGFMATAGARSDVAS